MPTPALEPTSARKAGWVVVVLLVGFVAFVFIPFGRKTEPSEPLEVRPPSAAQLKLQAAGLAENPDWYGLPDLFAAWGEGLPWEQNRVDFAYWNPGARSYSYFFAAMRTEAGIRFRALTRAESIPLEPLVPAKVREGETPETHPFAFLVRPPKPTEPSPPMASPAEPVRRQATPAVADETRVRIDLPVETTKPPPPELRTDDHGGK